MYCLTHIRRTGIFRTLSIIVNSDIFRHIHVLFRHNVFIQKTLPYSEFLYICVCLKKGHPVQQKLRLVNTTWFNILLELQPFRFRIQNKQVWVLDNVFQKWTFYKWKGVLKIVGRKLRLPKERVVLLSQFLNANITLQLLESITHNDIIKILKGKKDYAISEINIKAFFSSDSRKKQKYFYIVKEESVKKTTCS